MSAKPYDPTLKTLVETEPESWPALLGRPLGPTTVIDADIATVTGAADKVLRVAAEPPYLLHLEFVAGHDGAALPRKLLVRNALLDDRHDLLVRSAAILLQPAADSPQLRGVYERRFPEEQPHQTFRYQVVRVWELLPEALLTGGLALLPLAPISAATEAELPGVIERMQQRLSGRRARSQARQLWSATILLSGLRFTPDQLAYLFRGVMNMKESSVYQAALEEGVTKGAVGEARKLLRLLAVDAFGPPDARTARALEQLADLDRLEELHKRLRTAASWQELFGQPAPSRRTTRRRQEP